MSDVFTHPWLGGLFADDEIAALWRPEAQLAAMQAFEIAWSRALGRAGLVPEAEAEQAALAIGAMRFDLDDLRRGTGQDGVVVPRLVAQMKAGAGAGKGAVHRGATSQDVIDTALALAMRDTIIILEQRLAALDATLSDLDARFGAAPLMGRTRMQAATMVTVADRVAPWRLALAGHRARLAALTPRGG